MSQMQPILVDAAWLAARPQARVIDVRWSPKGPPGKEKYLAGHLPGAVYVDLETDLSHPDKGPTGRHPLPTSEAFAGLLARLGVAEDTHVVVYDDARLAYAARLWFMLRAFGHARVSLLDGGLEAWTAAGLPLETAEPRVVPAAPRALKPDDSLFATRGEIEDVARGRSQTQLLDARAPERYRGELEPLDRVPGHIPGAVNAPFARNLREDGRFRSADELRALYAAFGPAPICSCGSGVTACHDAVALALIGARPRLYVGSYSEWSHDPARPIATGDSPRGQTK